MNNDILNLEPKPIWRNFALLNAVPRASKKEEKVIAFMKNFATQLQLETYQDEVGNLIIRKPATPGMENRKPIVMQGHLDMVHQKNADTVFDFDTQGINMYVEGDWVKAKGTTLGADNGLGVATIMAVLESTDIAHPDLEALFTIDEETGMTGALNLKGGLLKGEILLNLDTEEDDEIDIGCAGGLDVTAQRTYAQVPARANGVAYEIIVKGLSGGHSGMDINKGLGNANKIINRLLYRAANAANIQVAEIQGGGLRNAIPREGFAKIIVAAEEEAAFLQVVHETITEIVAEFGQTEYNLKITKNPTNYPTNVMELEAQNAVLRAIYAAQNGVYRMSATMPDLVETSNNIASVEVKNGNIVVKCLTRSSVESAKYDLAHALKSVFELGHFEVSFTGSYPGWTPNVNSEILKVLVGLYESLNNQKPRVVACHAGLECGILGKNYPGIDMISFGPTIHGAHSPDERASISSVKKYWKFVLAILQNIPEKV